MQVMAIVDKCCEDVSPFSPKLNWLRLFMHCSGSEFAGV